MAERRMFAKTIIDSDAFIEMPASTRLLYYDLGMRADDDGFVNSPKKIIKMTCASDDDMRILISKKFIIPFESGVVVIKHWKIHNFIAKDRYTETTYKAEKATLLLDENKAYTKHVDNLSTECLQPVNELSTQVSIGKESIGKVRKENLYTLGFETFWNNYPKKIGKKAAFKAWQSAKVNTTLLEKIMSAVDIAKDSEQWRKSNGQFIPNPATWLNQGRWDDEIENVQPYSSNPFKDILLKEMENEHQRNRVADGDYQNSISGVLPEPE